MDSRNFVIVDTRNNRNGVINNVTANTVGELRSLLREHGYDPTGMELHEGLTNSVLGNDNTPLPRNISYRGGVTSNLVIRLTTPRNKVKSGVMSRKEAYEKIKEYELQERIYDLYGKNYTQVKTEDLEREIATVDNQPNTPNCQAKKEVTLENIASAFNALIDAINSENYNPNYLNSLKFQITEKIGDYTLDEIEDMFSDM